MKFVSLHNIVKVKRHLREPLFKNSYLLMLNSFLLSASGFIFWIIAARYYTPNEVGLATAIFSISQLITSFSGFGLNYGLMRYLASSKNKGELINSSYFTTGMVSIILTLIFIFGLRYFSPPLLFLRENVYFFLFFIAFTVIYSLYLLQNSIFISLRSPEVPFCQNIIYNILRIGFLIILIPFGLLGIISSATVAVGLLFTLSTFYFINFTETYHKLSFRINFNEIKEISFFSIGNYLAGVLGSLPTMVMPLLILNMLGSSMAAYFYMTLSITTILSIIASAVSISLLTECSYERNALRNNALKSIKTIVILLIPSLIGFLLFGRHILLIFGKTYSENATILLWLFGVSSIPRAINELYMAIKRIQVDTKLIIYLSLLTAVSTIGMSYYLLANGIGIVGVGVAWILGQGLTTLVIGFLLIKEKWIC